MPNLTPTKPDPMSVKMESVLVVKIAGCNHRLTLEKARDLHGMLAKFLCGSAQSAGAQRVRDVKTHTIEYFGLNTETFNGPARHEVYTWPRFVAMSLAREFSPELRDDEIANEFGRERTMLHHALKEVKDRSATYPERRKEVDAIRAKINGNGGAQ